MSNKIKRKVTVEKSNENSEAPRKLSVFERLGPGHSRGDRLHVDGKEICLQWHQRGTCTYGDTCRYYHEPSRGANVSTLHSEPSRNKHNKPSEKNSEEKSKNRNKSKKTDLPIKDKTHSSKSKESHHTKKGESNEGKIKSTVVITRTQRSPPPSTMHDSLPQEEKRKKDSFENEAEGSSNLKWTMDAPPPTGKENRDWPLDAEQLDYKEEKMLEKKRQQLKRELEREMQKDQFSKQSITAPEKTSKSGESSSSTSSSGDSDSSSSDSSGSSSSSDESDSSSSSSSSSSAPSTTTNQQQRRPRKKKRSSKEPGEIREKKKSKHRQSSHDPPPPKAKEPAAVVLERDTSLTKSLTSRKIKLAPSTQRNNVPLSSASTPSKKHERANRRKSSSSRRRREERASHHKKHDDSRRKTSKSSSKSALVGRSNSNGRERPERPQQRHNDRSDRRKSKKRKDFRGSGKNNHKAELKDANTIPLTQNKFLTKSPGDDDRKSKDSLISKFHRALSPDLSSSRHSEKRRHSPSPMQETKEKGHDSKSHKRKDRGSDQHDPPQTKRIRMHTPSPPQRFVTTSPSRRVEEVTRTVRRRSPSPFDSRSNFTSRMDASPPPMRERSNKRMSSPDLGHKRSLGREERSRMYDESSVSSRNSGYKRDDRGRSPEIKTISTRNERKDRGKSTRLHGEPRAFEREIGRNSPIVLERMRSPDMSHEERKRMMTEKERGGRGYRDKSNRSLSPRPRGHSRHSPDHELSLHHSQRVPFDEPLPPPEFHMYGPEGGSGYLDERSAGAFSDYGPPPRSDPNLYSPPPSPRYAEYPPPPCKEGFLDLEMPPDRGVPLMENRWSPPPRGHREEEWGFRSPLPHEPLHMDDERGYNEDRGRPRRGPPPRKNQEWPRHDPRDRDRHYTPPHLSSSGGKGPRSPKREVESPPHSRGSWEQQSRQSTRDSRHRDHRSRDESRSSGDRHRSDSRTTDRDRRPHTSRKQDTHREEERTVSKRASPASSHKEKSSSHRGEKSSNKSHTSEPPEKSKEKPAPKEKSESTNDKRSTFDKHHAPEKHPEEKPSTKTKSEPPPKKEHKEIKKKKEEEPVKEEEEVDDGDHIVVSPEDFSDWTEEDADLDILTKDEEFVEVKEVTGEGDDDEIISEHELSHEDTKSEKGSKSPAASPLKDGSEMGDELITTDCVDYDPISDEEFEALMEEPEEKQEPVKETSGIASVLQVDWASLVNAGGMPPKPTSVQQRFSAYQVLSTMGFSQAFAGPELTAKIIKHCQEQLEAEQGKDSVEPFTMEHPVAAFHATIKDNKRARAEVFYNVGPFRKALCARHDLQIRKLLCKPLDRGDWSANQSVLISKLA